MVASVAARFARALNTSLKEGRRDDALFLREKSWRPPDCVYNSGESLAEVPGAGARASTYVRCWSQLRPVTPLSLQARCCLGSMVLVLWGPQTGQAIGMIDLAAIASAQGTDGQAAPTVGVLDSPGACFHRPQEREDFAHRRSRTGVGGRFASQFSHQRSIGRVEGGVGRIDELAEPANVPTRTGSARLGRTVSATRCGVLVVHADQGVGVGAIVADPSRGRRATANREVPLLSSPRTARFVRAGRPAGRPAGAARAAAQGNDDRSPTAFHPGRDRGLRTMSSQGGNQPSAPPEDPLQLQARVRERLRAGFPGR